MTSLRRILLRLLTGPLRFLAGILRKPQMGGDTLENVMSVLRPGDVILTYRRGLVARLIPGYWSHAALYIGEGRIIHAVYPEVTGSHVASLIVGNDNLLIVRPRFATPGTRMAAIVEMRRFVGKPYDLGFGPGRDAFYCSEAVATAYKTAMPEWDFEWRERLGVPTVTPQDLADASDHFERVWHYQNEPTRNHTQ